ncbi:hypothetical protein [Paenibacillus sp. P36]|uniref:hypothetical protein n=1 Tax=Paenibacillus sp. P36 TaxID=3342538 RepID=UPI0038B33346
MQQVNFVRFCPFYQQNPRANKFLATIWRPKNNLATRMEQIKTNNRTNFLNKSGFFRA